MSNTSHSLYERRKLKKKESKRKLRERREKYPADISNREIDEVEKATTIILKRLGYEMMENKPVKTKTRDLYYEVRLNPVKISGQNRITISAKSAMPSLILQIMYSEPEKMVREIGSNIDEIVKKYNLDLSVFYQK